MMSSIQLTVICTLCHIFFLLAQIAFADIDKKALPSDVAKTEANMKSDVNETSSTSNGDNASLVDLINNNRDMLRRAMYVTLAVTGILVVYFGIRFIRARRRKVKQYGRLRNSGQNMEMSHLESDSDDNTLFDARKALMQ